MQAANGFAWGSDLKRWSANPVPLPNQIRTSSQCVDYLTAHQNARGGTAHIAMCVISVMKGIQCTNTERAPTPAHWRMGRKGSDVYLPSHHLSMLQSGKLEPSSICITFLTIELNSKTMTLSLPSSKLDSIITELQSWTPRARATKHQLQSLAGKLNYAARVVRGGGTFLRWLLNCICSLQKPYHKARISGAMLQDIQLWQNHMSTFNGISVYIPAWDVVTVITDACGTCSVLIDCYMLHSVLL